MVAAARTRGHRYLAICDHARRLRNGRLERQAETIAELNERHDDIRILSGVEVDIRADGSLDLDDESPPPDGVVASIPPASRISRSADRPHPGSARQPARRLHRPSDRAPDRGARVPARSRDDARRAAETGTALELNRPAGALDLRTPTHGSPPRRAHRSSSRATPTGRGARYLDSRWPRRAALG
jgi:DNA polymerase (family 10)